MTILTKFLWDGKSTLKQESFKLEMNLLARMGDGVMLFADIYRPDL